VQSVRTRIGIQFEKSTGIMNQHIHKDLNTTHEMLKTLATMRGRLSGPGKPGANGQQPVSNEAGEALRRADQSEAAQDKMANLVGKLVNLAEEKQNAGS